MEYIDKAFHAMVLVLSLIFIAMYSVDLIYDWKERRRIRKILEKR